MKDNSYKGSWLEVILGKLFPGPYSKITKRKWTGCVMWLEGGVPSLHTQNLKASFLLISSFIISLEESS
jgi:hypothetical protein